MRRLSEIVIAGIGGHAGCIAACLGVGLAAGSECGISTPQGHPLSFLMLQGGLLLFAVMVGWCYFKLRETKYRLPILAVLIAALFAPAVAPLAGAGLQAIFVVQLATLAMGVILKSPACCTEQRSVS